MRTFTVDEPFLDVKCGLAESPFWEATANVLRFVDIPNRAVYRVSLDEGAVSLQKTLYDSCVSVTGELASADDDFVFGGKYGVGVASKSGGKQRYVQQFWSGEEKAAGKDARMRANDGAVDSQGRFWVNAICDPEATSEGPEGALFRLDADGSFHRVLAGAMVPNGMSWSQDDTVFYFTDTSDASIYAYDFDAPTGDISNRRLFFRPEGEGTAPDGHAQDADGNLWVAIWGGWKVVQVSPEGKVLAEVSLPTRCPTAVAFAGEDIYITSETEHEPETYPQSTYFHGDVFKCHVGVRGRPTVAARVKVD